MAREYATLRIAALALLTSCAGSASWPDLSEPLVPSDLEPLPETVTAANAREVVRKCLQRQGRDETNAHRRFGYAFRDAGFVQFHRTNAIDRGNRDEASRFYVDYRSVQATSSRVRVDTARFRERVEVTITGRFRRWHSRVTPYAEVPGLDQETEVRDAAELVLVFDDPLAARKLQEGLTLLMKKE